MFSQSLNNQSAHHVVVAVAVADVAIAVAIVAEAAVVVN
jgi:hypothetical protein